MKKIILLLTPLFILIFSGCSSKEESIHIEYQDRYITPPIYDFQVIDYNGAKIKINAKYLKSKTVRVGVHAYQSKVPFYEFYLAPGDVDNICRPYLLQAKEFYNPIINFYGYQIDQYNKQMEDYKNVTED